MSRITRTALALVASAAIAGACASSGTAAPSPSPSATAAPKEMSVDIQGFKFPATLEVAKGTKVTWTNKDTTKHTVTSGTRPTKDGKFDGQVDAGGTFSFTFTEAGTFNYFCTFHPSMNATVTVK